MDYASPVSQISGVHGWKKCFAPLPRTVYLVKHSLNNERTALYATTIKGNGGALTCENGTVWPGDHTCHEAKFGGISGSTLHPAELEEGDVQGKPDLPPQANPLKVKLQSIM